MSRPNPYQYIKKGNPSSGVGQFEYWNGSFKEAISQSADGLPGTPFKNVVIGGKKDYQDTSNFGDNARLELESVFSGTSGYVHLRMNPGWQGLFYVKSENNDFFEDNAIDEYVSDNWNNDDSFTEELGEAQNLLAGEWPTIWVQDNAEASDSRTVFGLDQGDYMSFDVDGESGQVAQARIRISGVDYIDNTESSNELFITCVWLRYWNPTKPVPNYDPGAIQGPLEPDGQGDIDGDGIIDGEDETPRGEEKPPEDGMFSCPVGFKDNGFGICIPDDSPDDDDDNDDDDNDTSDDVSAVAMAAVVVGIGLVIYMALRVV